LKKNFIKSANLQKKSLVVLLKYAISMIFYSDSKYDSKKMRKSGEYVGKGKRSYKYIYKNNSNT
jgi:hypothetical protein